MDLIFDAQSYYQEIDRLNLTEHFLELDLLPREWWKLRWIPNPESVSTHTLWAILLVLRYKTELEALWADIQTMQLILLLHDVQEKEEWVGDITPHCNITSEEKKRREVTAIERILKDRPDLLKLWYDYTEKRTLEWRLCKEIDKLDAIEVAWIYERKYSRTHPESVRWLVEEFYASSVIKKKQIQTAFLLARAEELYGAKE